MINLEATLHLPKPIISFEQVNRTGESRRIGVLKCSKASANLSTTRACCHKLSELLENAVGDLLIILHMV
jgi:hypothetical protein